LEIPHSTQEELHKWIKHTHDRPFNDRRYAVDGTKLRKLGWDQKTSFEKGLAITVDWYRKFGEHWWGDITKVLTPFPEVANKKVVAAKEVPVENIEGDMVVDKNDEMTLKKRKLDGETNGHTDAMVS
jgi:dTDP-glucose 4,6-dehydratase